MSSKSHAGVFNSKTKYIHITREPKQLGNITVSKRNITDDKT